MADPSLRRAEVATGRARDVGVTITGLTFKERPDGRRRWPYGEFGGDFIVALHEKLPKPARRGLLRGSPVCPFCGSSFDGVTVEAVKISAQLDLRQIPPLTVDVEIPGRRCPRCGRPVTRMDDTAVAADLSDAVIAAFRSQGLDV
jgi:uncharacterized protein (UPF0212 family)